MVVASQDSEIVDMHQRDCESNPHSMTPFLQLIIREYDDWEECYGFIFGSATMVKSNMVGRDREEHAQMIRLGHLAKLSVSMGQGSLT